MKKPVTSCGATSQQRSCRRATGRSKDQPRDKRSTLNLEPINTGAPDTKLASKRNQPTWHPLDRATMISAKTWRAVSGAACRAVRLGCGASTNWLRKNQAKGVRRAGQTVHSATALVAPFRLPLWFLFPLPTGNADRGRAGRANRSSVRTGISRVYFL